MKANSKVLISVGLLLVFVFYSCKSDDPQPVNEEELITTIIYELTDTSTGEVATLKFTDLDGEGGNPPVQEGGNLRAAHSYTGKITLLDESKTPPINITEEVEEEAEDHQFFYQTHSANLIISYADIDDAGYPVGLLTDVVSGSASEGTLILILRHMPDKSASGVSDGDITNAGGETDIEVAFDVVID